MDDWSNRVHQAYHLRRRKNGERGIPRIVGRISIPQLHRMVRTAVVGREDRERVLPITAAHSSTWLDREPAAKYQLR